MIELPKLNFYNTFDFKIKKDLSKLMIFDIIRQKYVNLSPEEWVRQHWVHFFLAEKKFSKSAILLEKQIILNNTIKRIDILILKKNEPFILLECKSPKININSNTFEQIARYNSIIKAKNIFISNGINHLKFGYSEENSCYNNLSEDFIL